jgi:dihydrofolate synthase/folylpolyglutamate synthase
MPTRSPVERLFELETFGIKLGLDNPSRLAARLDHPERAYPTVHVAGTNGKGSVAAFVSRALEAQGYRTGTYTSPHLVELTERFRIDGVPVERAELDEALVDVLGAMDALCATGVLAAPATYFEVTTLAAFELFRRRAVDVAVIEVGLGGRFDATNILTPLVSVITSIALDHQQHLGSTLADIAREKAGIVKPRVPVVVGALPPEARAVVDAVCRERGAPLVDASHVTTAADIEGGSVTARFTAGGTSCGPVRLGLLGRHQLDNARVAVATLETLGGRGLRVASAAIAEGLSRVSWPGRLQMVEVGGGRRLLVDGAHNAAGVEALARFAADARLGAVPLVWGVMEDKDAAEMLRAIPPVTRIVCTQAPVRRARAADELGRIAARLHPGVEVLVEPDPGRAVASALAAGPLAIVAGSLYLVGHVLRLIRAGTLW